MDTQHSTLTLDSNRAGPKRPSYLVAYIKRIYIAHTSFSLYREVGVRRAQAL